MGAQTPEPLYRDFSARADVVYTPSDWPEQLTGTVYRPAGAGPYPGVLVVHGGGWEQGKSSDMTFMAERLARRGYVAFNIAYRFAPPGPAP